MAEDKDNKDLNPNKDGLGFCIAKDGFHWLSSTQNIELMFLASFARKKEGDKPIPVEVFDTKYLSLTIADFPQYAYVGYAAGAPKEVQGGKEDKGTGKPQLQAGYRGEIKDAELILKLRDSNKFFSQVLKDDIKFTFGTFLWYDLHKGLDFGGDAKLTLEFDLDNKKIGPVSFKNFIIDSGLDFNDGGKANFDVKTSFSVGLESFTVSLENLGVGMGVKFLKEDGSIGDWDFSPRFDFPTGLGIVINCSAVEGGGYISYDKDKGEFLGVLQLNVIKKFGVGGFLLCNLGNKPGHDFNLVTLISFTFPVGIPLGMGFTLNKVGGVIGINRMLDRNAMIQGVRSGTLESVFFIENLKDHINEMKTSIVAFFPEKKGQFFLGFLGKICYEPVLGVNFGLLLQAPKPTEIIIVGAVRVTIDGADDLILINVNFAGGINFLEGIWFDASIVNSHIVGIDLHGDMAFRLFWGGATKGFLLSLGGFHPAYTPEEGMMVSNMKRIGVGLNYSVLKMSLDTYLALTSNTFQIGARFDLKVDLAVCGITGYAGFDCLFQFDPFMFMFDMCAGVAVKVGSVKLLSIDLAMAVSGPRPWNASGTAKFWLVFVPIKAEFDITWGGESKQLPSKTVEVHPLLLEQFANASNWSVKANSLADGQVTFFEFDPEEEKTGTLVLQPYEQVVFTQSAVPFCTADQQQKNALTRMELFNSMVPTDYDFIAISSVTVGANTKVSHRNEKNDFAPSLFKNLSMDEKLSSPSYVRWDSGFTLDSLAKRKAGKDPVQREIGYNVVYWQGAVPSPTAGTPVRRSVRATASSSAARAVTNSRGRKPVTVDAHKPLGLSRARAHQMVGNLVGVLVSWRMAQEAPKAYKGNSKEAFRRRMVQADKALASKADFSAMLNEL